MNSYALDTIRQANQLFSTIRILDPEVTPIVERLKRTLTTPSLTDQQEWMELIEFGYIRVETAMEVSPPRPPIYTYLHSLEGRSLSTADIWAGWAASPHYQPHPLHPTQPEELPLLLTANRVTTTDQFRWTFPREYHKLPFVSTIPVQVDAEGWWRFVLYQPPLNNRQHCPTKVLFARLQWFVDYDKRQIVQAVQGVKPLHIESHPDDFSLLCRFLGEQSSAQHYVKRLHTPRINDYFEIDELLHWMQTTDRWMYVRLCSPTVPLPGLLPEQELTMESYSPLYDPSKRRGRSLSPEDRVLVYRYLQFPFLDPSDRQLGFTPQTRPFVRIVMIEHNGVYL